MKLYKLKSLRQFALIVTTLFVLVAPLHAAKTNIVSTYLPTGKPDAVALLAPPPLPGSSEQAADLQEVLTVHAACSANEAAIAEAESDFTMFNFTPAIGSFFQPGKFPKTEALLDRVMADSKIAVSTAKNYWKRPRPYTVDPSLAVGKLEKSFGYPSGHSTEATVYALVLANIFPDKEKAILAEGRAIGWHRVEIARHYPTDIYAGRVFAQAIVRELMASPQFQHDLDEAKAEIAAARKN